jgi:hypothetical protein
MIREVTQHGALKEFSRESSLELLKGGGLMERPE